MVKGAKPTQRMVPEILTGQSLQSREPREAKYLPLTWTPSPRAYSVDHALFDHIKRLTNTDGTPSQYNYTDV